jgi:hypothetical protein
MHEIAEAFALKVHEAQGFNREEKERLLAIVAGLNEALLREEPAAVAELMRIFQRAEAGLKPKKKH